MQGIRVLNVSTTQITRLQQRSLLLRVSLLKNRVSRRENKAVILG